MNREIVIRSIKILDIFYITAVYIMTAFFVSYGLDKHVLGKVDKEKQKKKSLAKQLVEVCIMIGLLGSLAYIIKNIIHLIPFPLEGVYGFKHLKVHDVQSGLLLIIYLEYFSEYSNDKLHILKDKLNEINDKSKNSNNSNKH